MKIRPKKKTKPVFRVTWENIPGRVGRSIFYLLLPKENSSFFRWGLSFLFFEQLRKKHMYSMSVFFLIQRDESVLGNNSTIIFIQHYSKPLTVFEK